MIHRLPSINDATQFEQNAFSQALFLHGRLTGVGYADPGGALFSDSEPGAEFVETQPE